MYFGPLAFAALLAAVEATAAPQRQPGAQGGLFPGIFGDDEPPQPPGLPPVPPPAQHSVTSALGIVHTITSTRLPNPFGDDDPQMNYPALESTTTASGADAPGITFAMDGPTTMPTSSSTVSDSTSQSSTAATGLASPVKVSPSSASSARRPARVNPGSDGEEAANANNAIQAPEERKLKTGQTVGIFAGTFVGCVGLLVLAWYWRRVARACAGGGSDDGEPDVILPASASKTSGVSGCRNNVKRPQSHWTAPPPMPVPSSYGGLHARIQNAMGVQRWSLRPGDVVRLPGDVVGRQIPVQPQPQPGVWWRRESAAPRSPVPRHANII